MTELNIKQQVNVIYTYFACMYMQINGINKKNALLCL